MVLLATAFRLFALRRGGAVEVEGPGGGQRQNCSMTYTEAAVEVLRRAGHPMNFKDIAEKAVAEGLLSHVGGSPDVTMGARLLAMARRESERRIVATEAGVFALAEWGLAPAASPALEAEAAPPESEEAYRTRERHPPLQDELVVGARREERRRRSDDDDGRRRKRYGPPSESAHAWLRERNEPATLAEIAAGLRASDKIAEALERDLGSFERSLREENNRREQSGRGAIFAFLEDGRIEALEIPKDQRPPRKETPPPAPRAEKRREEPVRFGALEEQRRQVLRLMRRRLSGLDVAALERVVVALLEAQGFRELNMARRHAKEGPLYLARHRWGASELRYAVRVLRPGREIGRNEIQDLRRDAGHFSAQLAVVFGNGECTREAKSEANTAGGCPVMMYGNEALAEALIEAKLGVSIRTIEWPDFDEAFFASMGAGDLPEEMPELAAPEAEAPPAAPPEAREERGGRRRRERRGRGDRPSGAPEEGPSEAGQDERASDEVVSETTAAEPEGATVEAPESGLQPVEAIAQVAEVTAPEMPSEVEPSTVQATEPVEAPASPPSEDETTRVAAAPAEDGGETQG